MEELLLSAFEGTWC